MSAPFGPDELLGWYRRGVFPMAESRESDRVFLVDPEWRCVLPLAGFHIPSRLRRTVRSGVYQVTVNQDFAAVLDACAAPAPGREETWINPDIRSLYLNLHARGAAHSIECRDGEGRLVGGLYGVALGGAFFGESMFSTARDASKVALVHLVARLIAGGFALLDAQFWTSHLSQFGAEEIPRRRFRALLSAALRLPASFPQEDFADTPDQVLQRIAQTS